MTLYLPSQKLEKIDNKYTTRTWLNCPISKMSICNCILMLGDPHSLTNDISLTLLWLFINVILEWPHTVSQYIQNYYSPFSHWISVRYFKWTADEALISLCNVLFMYYLLQLAFFQGPSVRWVFLQTHLSLSFFIVHTFILIICSTLHL